MHRIGLDFGTTNSILSYHDAESGMLRCFHHAAGDTDYVPTVIAYEMRRGMPSILIGKAARLLGEGAEHVCGHFKLRLGKDFDALLPGKQKTAHEAASDYIRELLDAYRAAGNPIDGMVMTIPDAWFRVQSHLSSREHLRQILAEIGFPKGHYTFQSEPVAAAAYFCRQWETLRLEPYQGKLLVFDYGGGTLDVTLCRISDNGRTIQTLDNYGTGTEETGAENGCAGSAFLARAVELICADHSLSPDVRTFALACMELEEHLISRKSAVDELMEEYEISPEDAEDEPLFTLSRLGDCAVFCRHLYQAFQEINAPALLHALQQINGADAFDLDTTKIIFVGGFCNFYCVTSAVRSFFHSRSGTADPRFPEIFSNENSALAIAKGAALLADGMQIVESVFPYEVGLIAARPDAGDPEKTCSVQLTLIRKLAKTELYAEPVFLPERITVIPHAPLFLQLYRVSGGQTAVFRMQDADTLRQIFPPSDYPQVFEIGLSVDDDLIPTLHTRDAAGIVRGISLNRLLESHDEVRA